MSDDTFWWSRLRECCWHLVVETRDAVLLNALKMLRTAPTTKKDWVPNVACVEVKKL